MTTYGPGRMARTQWHDGKTDPANFAAVEVPVATLPDSCLLYLMGSRYCETDKLCQTAGRRTMIPSGIATYSQVGAQFGYGLAWALLFGYPLMCAIEEISARIAGASSWIEYFPNLTLGLVGE